MKQFEEIKKEILERAHNARAVLFNTRELIKVRI